MNVFLPLYSVFDSQSSQTIFGHAALHKYWGLSAQLGFDKLSQSALYENVAGQYNSAFANLLVDYKLLPSFWVSAGGYMAQVKEQYQATLGGTNFYPQTIIKSQHQLMVGVMGRMSYFGNLTDRIALQVFTDMGLALDTINNDFVSVAHPGFLLETGRILYLGFGINVGYRFGLRG
ncbi:hypothetical protein GC194_00015 [bacterium]|nr:hypothetical protein [bacterium]